MSNKEKITILIPTMNRADFLSRLLYYFADTKYQDWIFIGDSSNDTQMDETKKTIKSLEGSLKIRYFECPGLSVTGAIEHMDQFINTPYTVLCPDDDFLCVSGVERCIDFLEDNPDYGVAHGIGMATSLVSGPYGNISRVENYPHINLNAESGSQRLRDFFAAGTYTLQHDIHRTSDWQELNKGFKNMPWARQGFIFDGLISSVISAIRNKAKELDCLYLVRFGHDRIYSQVLIYDWFTNRDWYPGFKDLHARAIDELIREDGINKETAEEVFRQAILPYLGRLFSQLLPQNPQSYKPGALPRLMKIGRHIPGLKAAYDTIMPRFRAQNETNLLSWLLKPGSPYHQDFMPIYRSITAPSK